MAFTQLDSSRNKVSIDSVQWFRIVTVCIAKGDLPDPGLFVYQIHDSDDPAKDAFVRVSEIVDFDLFSDDRPTAVAAGDEYWRSYLLTKFYTNIQVADAAKTAIPDRVDELATDYNLYIDDFETSSEIVNLPSGEDTLLQSLNADYNTAYVNYVNAVASAALAAVAKSDADTELTAAQTAQQQAQEVYDSSVARTAEMSSAKASMDTFNGASGVLIKAIDTFQTAYNASGSGVDDEFDDLVDARNQFTDTDRNNFIIAIGEAQASVSTHQSLEALITTNVLTPANTRLTSAEDAVRTTTQALLEAEAAVAAAYTALEDAYAAAKAACNSWTPDNPFPPIV